MIHNINNFQEKNNINLKYDDILIKNIKDDFDKKTNSLTHLNKKENKNRQNKPKKMLIRIFIQIKQILKIQFYQILSDLLIHIWIIL